MSPALSSRAKAKQQSAIRRYGHLRDGNVHVIHAEIGNVREPMHPKMQERYEDRNNEGPFKHGSMPYSVSEGYEEANVALLNIIAANGFDTNGLYSLVTNGGSEAIDIAIFVLADTTFGDKKPLLFIDPTYTNYYEKAADLNTPTVSVTRKLGEDGVWSWPAISELEAIIESENPSALVIIPYDNPTGQFIHHERLKELAELCVKYDMWLVSDEAYRPLVFLPDAKPSSIWALTDKEVRGIEGSRISIESASKVFNVCGQRIGGLVTDNREVYEKAVAKQGNNLCANVFGQWLLGALASEDPSSLQAWFAKQRAHYRSIIDPTLEGLRSIPGFIVSQPQASFYSTLDGRNFKKFGATQFADFCETQSFHTNGTEHRVKTAPIANFYHPNNRIAGRTQLRVSYTLPREDAVLVPLIFHEQLRQYLRTVK